MISPISKPQEIDANAFTKELEQLLNKYSIDNYMNMPDFMLADYIVTFMVITVNTRRRLEEWEKS